MPLETDFTRYSISESELLTNSQLQSVVRVAARCIGAAADGADSIVVAEVSETIKPDYCAIWRNYSGNALKLELGAKSGFTSPTQVVSQDMSPGGQAEYAAFTGAPVMIPDLKSEQRFQPSRFHVIENLQSGIIIPLTGSGRFHGLLEVFWREERNLDPHERSFLTLMGKILFGALDLVASNDELTRTSAQTQVLIEIGKLLGSSLQIENIYASFAELVGYLVPSDRMSLSLLDESTGMSRTAFNFGMDLGLVDPAEEHPISGTISGEVAGLRRPVIVNSRNEHEYTHRLPQLRRYFEAGLVSTLSVPVVWHDRVVAALTMRSLKENAYDDKDADLANKVAAMLAGTIVNAEMHRTLDQLASERLMLTEIGWAVNSAPNERTAFARLATRIGQLMSADRITLSALDDSGHSMRRRFISGMPIGAWREGTVVNISDSTAQTCLELNRPNVYYPDQMSSSTTSALQLVAQTFIDVEIKSVMYVPLFYGGRAEGVISICSRNEDAFGEREISLADRIASLISPFIAVSKMNEKYDLIRHHRNLASALLDRSIREKPLLNFLTEIEEEITAAARCDIFLLCELDKVSGAFSVKFSGGVARELVPVGEVAASMDESGHITTDHGLKDRLTIAGILTELWVPIRKDDRLIGVIGVFAYRHRSIGRNKRKSMELLADVLSEMLNVKYESRVKSPSLPVDVSVLASVERADISSSGQDQRASNIVIVDAHLACRGAIRLQMARFGLKVVAECKSIVDVQSASEDGCEMVVWGAHAQDNHAALRDAGRFNHLFKILVLTDSLSIDGLREALRAGISGYVSRSTDPSVLKADVERALAGGTVIDSTLLSVFFSQLPTNLLGLTGEESNLLSDLGERDILMLTKVAQGDTNVAIAEELNLAVGSVKNRLVELYRLIGVTDRVEATAFALRAGLLK